jgi:hypothetical protein
MVPTFTLEPLDGLGAQLCPCGFATSTPQGRQRGPSLVSAHGRRVAERRGNHQIRDTLRYRRLSKHDPVSGRRGRLNLVS